MSIGQLEQLGRAAQAARADAAASGGLTADDFVRAAGQVHDPNVAIEVVKAAVGCGVILNPPASL